MNKILIVEFGKEYSVPIFTIHMSVLRSRNLYATT